MTIGAIKYPVPTPKTNPDIEKIKIFIMGFFSTKPIIAPTNKPIIAVPHKTAISIISFPFN